MGAFGTGPWENDDARDFLANLEGLGGAQRSDRVLGALDRVLSSGGLVEAPEMSEAVAAAAVVGASLNPRAASGERSLPAWVAAQPLALSEELIEKSRQLLRRAVRSHDSEWWELWDEAGLTADVESGVQRALAWLGDRDD